jgi:hypothetical protein
VTDTTAQPSRPPESEPDQDRENRFFARELFIGSVVAILTILTAVAAFQASRLGVDAGRASARSVRTLLESNAAFLSSNQEISADLTLYGLSLNPELDETERAFYESSFSPALREALERSGDGAYPFDQGYDEYQFGLANELFDDVFELVDQSGEKRAQNQRFQLATFIFAIALAFSSWASLAADGTRMRHGFSLLAVAVGAVGVVAYSLAVQTLL